MKNIWSKYKGVACIIILLAYMWGVAWAADTALTSMTNDASPTDDDIIYSVNDPGGTPADRKVTWANLWVYVYGKITSTIGASYDTSAELDALFASKLDANATQIVATFNSGSCSGYLKSDETCDTPAGGGNVTASGTPAQYQWGEWVDSTHLKGTAVTASKLACSDANGAPIACTSAYEAALIALMPNYVDQDVTSGAAPTFTANNFSDGGSNIIPTSTQETNWDDAYTRTGHLWNDRTALTGGAAGALDALSVAILTDGDIAFVRVGQILYVYLYDADATAAENSPDVIRPDDYATQGNWELQLYISDGVIQLASVTTQLNLDDNLSLNMDATADGMADDSYNGETISGRNCGENLTQWDTVRLANDSDPWHQADANAAGEFPAIGISVAACTDTNAAVILVKGVVRNEGWTGLTPGGAVYLSTTAGGLTQTAPSTSGDAVQIIGWALSDSEIYFDFSRPYSEVQ